jgi:hypothetical protein
MVMDEEAVRCLQIAQQDPAAPSSLSYHYAGEPEDGWRYREPLSLDALTARIRLGLASDFASVRPLVYDSAQGRYRPWVRPVVEPSEDSALLLVVRLRGPDPIWCLHQAAHTPPVVYALDDNLATVGALTVARVLRDSGPPTRVVALDEESRLNREGNRAWYARSS